MASSTRPVGASKEDQERLVARLIHYMAHPDQFAEDVLGVELYSYQRQVLQDLARYDRVAIHSSHGVGKTRTEAIALIWFMFCFSRPKCVTTAPTDRQVKADLWAEVHYLMRTAKLELVGWQGKVDLGVKSMVLSRDVFAAGESVADPKNIEGYHAPNILYIVDEAKGVPDAVYDSIHGALSTGKTGGGTAKQLVCSTPGPCVGFFYRVCTGLERGWQVHHISAHQAAAEGQIDPDWIRESVEKWGTDSVEYHNKVDGIFDKRAGDLVINPEHVEIACQVQQADLGPIEVGVDVAREGQDQSAIAVRRGAAVLALTAHQNRDTVWLVKTVAAVVDRICDRYRVGRRQIKIKVDDGGVGGGVTDGLKHLGYRVVPVKAGARPLAEDKYVLRRDELWYEMADLFRRGQVDLTRLPRRIRLELTADLTAPIGMVTLRDDRRQVETKRATRSRLKRSPDMADALILAFARQKLSANGSGLVVLETYKQRAYDGPYQPVPAPRPPVETTFPFFGGVRVGRA